MGLLNKLFGKNKDEVKKEAKVAPWISLSTMDQLTEIKEKSATKAQIIFKHSTTCGISRMVINRFNEDYNLSNEQVDIYYLDLHNYRSISNEVAELFQVRHESPQILVIKNGLVLAHDSHSGISQLNLEQLV